MSSENRKIIEETTNFSITDSLKNGVDYASSILNSGNKWLKENDPFKFPAAEAYSVFDEPSPWDKHSYTVSPSPDPDRWRWSAPSTSSTYSSSIGQNPYSSSTLSSLSSDSVVNRPFAGNPNPSGQVFTNPGTEYKYCRLESYWEDEWVCTNICMVY